jgi:flagellar hook-length control protein FliK
MSSILFDPTPSSSGAAGTNNPSRSSTYVQGIPSFDTLLAKTQSRHEADSRFASDLDNRSRDYKYDRDYKTAPLEDSNTDSTVHSNDDDSSLNDENTVDEELSADTAYSVPEYDDSIPEYKGSEVAAVSTKTDDAAPDVGVSDEISGAAAVTGNSPQSGATATGATAAGATAAGTAAVTGSQAAPGASVTATAPDAQQPVEQAAANGTQATNITASVKNNALHSQSNTVLSSGAAVLVAQSVDPKATAGKDIPTTSLDPLVNAQAGKATEDGANTAQGVTAPQPVKARQTANANQAQANQAAPGHQGTGTGTTAGSGPATAGVAATTAGALTARAETPIVQSAVQPGSSTAFSSLVPVAGVTQAATGTAAVAAATGNASAGAAAPSEQVAVEIHKGIAAGKDSITIKLNPAELGKIDVKMELSDDGTLRATIAVEKAETLDLLQKDARGLERALQNAGLQADSGSLNFSLRGEGGGNSNGYETASNNNPTSASGRNNGAAEDDPSDQNADPARSSHDGAIDISV